jgi:hypothetical protein
MTEEEWLGCVDFEAVFDHLESKTANTQRKLRLFEVACCRRFTSRFPEPEIVNALNVAELFADSAVAKEELAIVHKASRQLEKESAMPGDGPETDALYYGAMAVREATSPDRPDYYCGTPDVIEHMIDAVAYASPSAPKDGHEGQAAFIGQVSDSEKPFITTLIHDIFGNPFRPVVLNPTWLTSTVLALATGIYEERAFDRMPILADALQDAGCDNDDVLAHCRGEGSHVRGCWVVDLVLGKT